MRKELITISAISIILNMLLGILLILQQRFLLVVSPAFIFVFFIFALYYIGQAVALLFHYVKKKAIRESSFKKLKLIVFLFSGIVIYVLFTYLMASIYNLPYTWQLLVTSLYSVVCYGIGLASMTMMVKLPPQRTKERQPDSL